MLGSSSSITMSKEWLTECLMLGSSSSITMTKEWLTKCLMLGSSSKYYHDQRVVDRVFNVGEFL